MELCEPIQLKNGYSLPIASNGGFVRIQVEFDKCGLAQIEELKEKTGISTYKELFNNALTILAWAVEQRESGRMVASIDEEQNQFRELQMPTLEHAAWVSASTPRQNVRRVG